MVYVDFDWLVHKDIDILKMLTMTSCNMFTIVRIYHFWVQQFEIFANTQQRCSQAGAHWGTCRATGDCAPPVQVGMRYSDRESGAKQSWNWMAQ